MKNVLRGYHDTCRHDEAKVSRLEQSGAYAIPDSGILRQQSLWALTVRDAPLKKAVYRGIAGDWKSGY